MHNHAGWGQAATKHVVPTAARGHVEGEPNVIHSQMFTSDTRIGGPIFLCFGGNYLINTISTCQRMWQVLKNTVDYLGMKIVSTV